LASRTDTYITYFPQYITSFSKQVLWDALNYDFISLIHCYFY